MSQAVSSSRMLLALGGIATISGVLIVSAYQLTLPTIERNKARLVREAVFDVLPKVTSLKVYTATDNGFAEVESNASAGQRFFAGYSADGSLQGLAIEAQGMGFADVIKLIYGYDPEKQEIIGMKVLESKETPGLGDKIAKDADFVANFEHLDVMLKPDRNGLVNPLTVVKHGKKNQAWQIEGITGATISSKAVGRILQGSSETSLPTAQRFIEVPNE